MRVKDWNRIWVKLESGLNQGEDRLRAKMDLGWNKSKGGIWCRVKEEWG